MPKTRVGSIPKEVDISPGPERKSKGIRSKEGCLTCRIRRKKCDQGKHADSCESCRRLHIECLGYSRNRPEWLKGVKVEEFKRTIKRFLAENSPKSGLHTRQDPSMPVPFLSFEGLRNRLANNTPPSLGSGALDYGAASGQFLDELDSTDGSDDETPRHYQLQPLKKEAPVLCKSPEPISSTNGPSQPQDPKDIHVLADDNASKSEEDLAEEISASNGAPKEKECATGDTSPATIPSTTRSPLDDQELLYYVNLIFPVLHELAGFSLSSQELLMVSKREPAIRTALVAQAKHHQNQAVRGPRNIQ
ncbi:hypothetical protein RSOLAG1IB_02107 [Rhizoctonia solani AG-1 IB]|uniref:Zn(2)-C6 fungal-type domain-containing protein n=1 Tax=Thanatephorus cucumeris (strain AG1-IB / isolate 7/3/14) TaxID=1108050 RepID=A0A0B7FMB3_THACB|nr:hypothetical protein RSOLAG1IB_02107 [Rhizoctonia solani AG-1 IB]